YDRPSSAISTDLTRLAGGPDVLAKLALQRIDEGQAVDALHLTNVALAADPQHRASLDARLKALDVLRARCHNAIERAWLDYDTRVTQEKRGPTGPASRE